MRMSDVATYPSSPPLLAMMFSPAAIPSITNTRQLGFAPANDDTPMPCVAFVMLSFLSPVFAVVFIITLVSFSHPANASPPIAVTFVSVSVSRLAHPANALSPVNIKDGTITITGTATSSGGRLVFLSDRFILSKGTYSLSMPNNAGVLSYLTRASDGVALSGRIIIDEDTEVAFGINVIHGTEYNVTLMPQLELGSEATPYEPYGYKIPVVVSAENHEPTTTNIYLNEPLRKIGDYADVIDFNRGVVERNTIEYAFTGAEAFWYTSSDENRAVAAFTFPNIRDKNVYFLNMFTIPPYSEMEYNRVVFDSNRICYVSLSYELIGGSYSDSNVTKLDNIRNWLKEQYESGNPLTMTIAYTSTTEPISLPSIPTFNGTTVISTDTQIQPSNIEIKYKARK